MVTGISRAPCIFCHVDFEIVAMIIIIIIIVVVVIIILFILCIFV